ncbi:phosphatidylinositol 3-and 4-kinase domain-containing protein [Cyclospora cayetanensis]|uniref:Phosphatidylinositol 3-and 4-kinase domain-containing protein n=1 Tax=Cyclospora cayetanensis TaxID=88456 RepID=A0A1D3D6K2_9EIME|nr:phosphatidylinositol 3-and 4-kinase domain-containing protein [Cyclospora cayetanensis]
MRSSAISCRLCAAGGANGLVGMQSLSPCVFSQVKDRHNGNVLISVESGRLMHIDFGFIMELSPGGDLAFERAPFKLTAEMSVLLGREQGPLFKAFSSKCIRGFLILREQADNLISFLEAMQFSGIACFKPLAVENLRSRFQLHLSPLQAVAFMEAKIREALQSFTTKAYDVVQHLQQGIEH